MESEPAPRLAALESEYVTMLFEAPFARVHRINLPAGAAIGPHEGGDRVLYSVNGYTVRLDTSDTEGRERSFTPGDVHFHSGGVHSVVNTGTGDASYLVFERTEAALGDVSPDGETLDAVSIPDGATHEILLENDRAIAHRITLDPGASLPPHAGYPRIVYALTEYTLAFVDLQTDERTERSFTEGDLHEHGAGTHQVENTGDSPAEYVVVAFKR
jgi:predicted metal-dependent enzyme (double-stranded beta helix superfamily)